MLEAASLALAILIWLLLGRLGNGFWNCTTWIGGLGFAIFAVVACAKWLMALPKGSS